MGQMPSGYRSPSGWNRRRCQMRAARLLLGDLGPAPSWATSERRLLSRGYALDVYEPAQPLGKTILMVYGFTLAGEKEARLVRFAQSFAQAGFRVVAPELPGLKALDLEVGDLDVLTDAIAFARRDAAGPIGIVGFSAGGGLALVAAARPALQGAVDRLFLIGPYHSLAESWARLWGDETAVPTSAAEWDTFIWRQLVLAYRRREALAFSPEQLAELSDLLQRYCFERSLARKREAYERFVQPHGVLEVSKERADLAVLEQLSPRGKLGALGAQVLLVHDPHDPHLPPEQSRQLLAELEQRGIPGGQRLLITPLLSHVTPRAVLNLPDLLALLDMLAELFPNKG